MKLPHPKRIRYTDIADQITSYIPNADMDLLERAYIYSAKVHKGQVRLSGEPYLNHPLYVAWILANMKMDLASVVAGLLHDTVEDTDATLKEIAQLFGDEIMHLVDGLTKIGKLGIMSPKESQAENLRKLILAMVEDLRVIIIKLADRLHNMRTLNFLSEEKQKLIARETMDLYAPIAHRMGIEWIKSELEDLSFKYLEPETYAAIESKLAKRKEEREKYVQEVIRVLRTALSNHNIKGEVTGRFKEVYSIYKKMTMHNLDFHDIYDITAFRIIVGTIGECYQTLGILHSLWKPVPGKFKDYIAIPKSNMYQSLHTTVIGPYGERIEIQIRTKEMHQLAEEGIAAHWAYKEGEQHDKKEVRQFEWLRRLMDANTEIKDQKEFLESVKITLFPDEVYVFTPKGEIKEFPIGATPVDFAYSIHTEVGHQCTGAKVNGKLVPLKYELKSGDTVEIITSSHHSPSKDWLSFVKTARARNKITQWIKARQREKSITLGKTMLEKQLKKYHLTLAKLSKNEEFTKLAEEFGFKTEDDLFATVGYGKLTPGQVIGKIIPENFQNGKEEKKEIEQKIDENQEIHVSDEIFVKGTSNIMTRIARCCNPLPGEPIVGFITRGRGITVHVANCPNILAAEPERKVDVEWGVTEDTIYRVRLEIEAIDKKGVLAEMTSVITSNDINIRKVSGGSTGKGNAKNTFEVEVYNVHQLNKLIKDIKGIEGIISVKRVRGLKAV